SAGLSAAAVTVPPRAHVTARILGLAAHRTDRPARFHERLHALDERRGLRARDGEARGRRLVAFLLHDGLRHNDDALAVLVPAEAQRGHGPHRLPPLRQGEALRARPRPRPPLVRARAPGTPPRRAP